jgi:hypothetical protein
MEPTLERSGDALFEHVAGLGREIAALNENVAALRSGLEAVNENVAALRAHLDEIECMTGRVDLSEDALLGTGQRGGDLLACRDPDCKAPGSGSGPFLCPCSRLPPGIHRWCAVPWATCASLGAHVAAIQAVTSQRESWRTMNMAGSPSVPFGSSRSKRKHGTSLQIEGVLRVPAVQVQCLGAQPIDGWPAMRCAAPALGSIIMLIATCLKKKSDTEMPNVLNISGTITYILIIPAIEFTDQTPFQLFSRGLIEHLWAVEKILQLPSHVLDLMETREDVIARRACSLGGYRIVVMPSPSDGAICSDHP